MQPTFSLNQTILCVNDGMVGLTPHTTHCRSFRRRFYGSHDPTNSIICVSETRTPSFMPDTLLLITLPI